MKASTVVHLRRKIGSWATHAHPEPDERDGPPNEIILAHAREIENRARANLDFVRAWRRELCACICAEIPVTENWPGATQHPANRELPESIQETPSTAKLP